MSESTQSKACCSLPPIVSKGYQAKGEYITVDGLKTYATGPKDAKTAILVIYDIFGFFDQTLQGADIIATSSNSKYQVFIPDFFEGSPADISWYPPDNKDKEKKLGEFFSTKAQPPKTLEKIPKILEQLKKERGIEKWGILGYCWGGKITNLASQSGTPFSAAAVCHPAMVSPDDAPGVTIPFAMLPSQDEDKAAVEKWESGLKVPHLVEWFPDQIHGFMAARANLDDEKVKKEYERGYKLVLEWFSKNL